MSNNQSLINVTLTDEKLALCHTGSLKIPADLKFDYQINENTKERCLSGVREPLIYTSNSFSDDTYCVAIYDKKSHHLRLMRAPLFHLSTRIKRDSPTHETPENAQEVSKVAAQRALLGEAFGSKKAKRALSDMRRNKVEADRLEDLEFDIVNVVKTSTEHLPSQKDMEDSQAADRPIPKFDLDATECSKIYPLSGIITPKELSCIHLSGARAQTDIKDRIAPFPIKTPYIISRVQSIAPDSDQDDKFKQIYYASLLIALHDNRRVSNKAALVTRLGNPSEVLVDEILKKFAKVKTGKSNSYSIDPSGETKLLCYLIALLLRLDDYHLHLSPLAQELSLKQTKLIEVARALGCTVKNATSAQMNELGLTKVTAQSYKIATLNAPLKIPPLVKRKRRQ